MIVRLTRAVGIGVVAYIAAYVGLSVSNAVEGWLGMLLALSASLGFVVLGSLFLGVDAVYEIIIRRKPK